jgi:hypothetical protein
MKDPVVPIKERKNSRIELSCRKQAQIGSHDPLDAEHPIVSPPDRAHYLLEAAHPSIKHLY